MDNEDIDCIMNIYMDNLNSCRNEYAMDNDGHDNPLTALLANSQYWDLNNCIQHCKSKETSNTYQGKILHLNIVIIGKFDNLLVDRKMDCSSISYSFVMEIRIFLIYQNTGLSIGIVIKGPRVLKLTG